MNPEDNFARLGLKLPQPPKPVGLYKPFLIVDKRWIYLSGHGPVLEDGTLIQGRIGDDLDLEHGKLAARQTGLTILATLKKNLGSLNAVKRVVKVGCMVNCPSSFLKHTYVINGCSELFAEVWGQDDGIGVRTAAGMGSLPENIAIEIDAMFELKLD